MEDRVLGKYSIGDQCSANIQSWIPIECQKVSQPPHKVQLGRGDVMSSEIITYNGYAGQKLNCLWDDDLCVCAVSVSLTDSRFACEWAHEFARSTEVWILPELEVNSSPSSSGSSGRSWLYSSFRPCQTGSNNNNNNISSTGQNNNKLLRSSAGFSQWKLSVSIGRVSRVAGCFSTAHYLGSVSSRANTRAPAAGHQQQQPQSSLLWMVIVWI